MATNPIFPADDLETVEHILSDHADCYPSTQALRRAIDGYRLSADQTVPYLTVAVGADPMYEESRRTNIDTRVRKDHVDGFVRQLATDPEVHTVKVNSVIVYSRPTTVTGIHEDALARFTA